MRYRDFEALITQMALDATPAAANRFASETLRQLVAWSADAIAEELTESERGVLATILTGLENRPPSEVATELEKLNGSMIANEVRAIEFSPNLTQFLSALESYIQLRLTGDSKLVASIALNAVNSVDYRIGGHDEHYSTENMLGSAAMVAEFERQQRLLVQPRDSQNAAVGPVA